MTQTALSHDHATLSTKMPNSADLTGEATHFSHDMRGGDPSLSPRLTLRWVLQRSAMGIVILATSIAAIAWLMHATIDPRPEPAYSSQVKAQTIDAQPAAVSVRTQNKQRSTTTGSVGATRDSAPKATSGSMNQATPVALQ